MLGKAALICKEVTTLSEHGPSPAASVEPRRSLFDWVPSLLSSFQPFVPSLQFESDVSPATILVISKAINGQQKQKSGKIEPNNLHDRVKRTQQVFEVIGDQP